jgi:hypothetical protein
MSDSFQSDLRIHESFMEVATPDVSRDVPLRQVMVAGVRGTDGEGDREGAGDRPKARD